MRRALHSLRAYRRVAQVCPCTRSSSSGSGAPHDGAACNATRPTAMCSTTAATLRQAQRKDDDDDGRTCTLTPHAFARLAPMIMLQQALQQHTLLATTTTLLHTTDTTTATAATEATMTSLHAPTSAPAAIVISRHLFDAFCRASHVRDSAAALRALHDAGLVVSLREGALVHLRPVLYLEQADLHEQLRRQSPDSSSSSSHDGTCDGVTDAACVLPPLSSSSSFFLTAAQARVDALAREERQLRAQLRPAIAATARWRRRLWATALLCASAQLVLVARLTYVDLSWDVMEPVTYCVGLATTLLFYVVYLRVGDADAYAALDNCYGGGVAARVRRSAPSDFDWAHYDAVVRGLVDARRVVRAMQQWADEH